MWTSRVMREEGKRGWAVKGVMKGKEKDYERRENGMDTVTRKCETEKGKKREDGNIYYTPG